MQMDFIMAFTTTMASLPTRLVRQRASAASDSQALAVLSHIRRLARPKQPLITLMTKVATRHIIGAIILAFITTITTTTKMDGVIKMAIITLMVTISIITTTLDIIKRLLSIRT
jgi:hypothetical protein